MYKIVHLTDMGASYLEIGKNCTDIFKMYKIVHLTEMYNFVHLEKITPNGIIICYKKCKIAFFLHSPPQLQRSPTLTINTTRTHNPPMPPKPKTKPLPQL
jgi:hypothetical protein